MASIFWQPDLKGGTSIIDMVLFSVILLEFLLQQLIVFRANDGVELRRVCHGRGAERCHR